MLKEMADQVNKTRCLTMGVLSHLLFLLELWSWLSKFVFSLSKAGLPKNQSLLRKV